MTSPWFVSGTVKNQGAKWRLFCFPFAGGSGHEFRTWGEQLPEAEVLGVLYPGRASRYRTPLIDNLAEMVAALLDEIGSYQDKPFAFFGHSLGALIAFELTCSLRRMGEALPQLLCISACDAPQLLPVPPIIHNLADGAFVEAIRNIGGTPEAILQHQQLLAMMLPILRADLKILETYKYEAGAPLNIPLYAVGGADDTVVMKENLLAWEQHTVNRWESQFFPGSHFYFREEGNNLLFPYLRTMLSREMTAD
jgi:surfactin synthase thioesterase subunit